jgi:hypothetical protein
MVQYVDELYGLPPDEFTAARNDLAARVAASGDKSQARAIKALRKPNLVAWTLNQLSRHHRATVERLVATHGGLGTAHGADELRSVAEIRRQLVSELVEAARDILEDAGVTSSQATLQKVSQSLYAGGSEQDRELLLQGRLVGDMGSPSLDSAFGLLPAEAEPASSEADERLEALREEAAAAQGAAAEAEELARELEAAARRGARPTGRRRGGGGPGEGRR